MSGQKLLHYKLLKLEFKIHIIVVVEGQIPSNTQINHGKIKNDNNFIISSFKIQICLVKKISKYINISVKYKLNFII